MGRDGARMRTGVKEWGRGVVSDEGLRPRRGASEEGGILINIDKKMNAQT